MGRSILGLSFTTKMPFVVSTAPLGSSTNGMPFLYDTTIDADSWSLVNAKTGESYPLNIDFLEWTGTQLYYNGLNDLFAYLELLGYYPCSGYYYYNPTKRITGTQ